MSINNIDNRYIYGKEFIEMYFNCNDKDASKFGKRRDIFDILRAAKKVSSKEARRMLRETLKNRKTS